MSLVVLAAQRLHSPVVDGVERNSSPTDPEVNQVRSPREPRQGCQRPENRVCGRENALHSAAARRPQRRQRCGLLLNATQLATIKETT